MLGCPQRTSKEKQNSKDRQVTGHDVLMTEGDAQRFALEDDVIFFLRTEAQAVVLAVAQGEADGAAVRLNLVACQREKTPKVSGKRAMCI